MRTFHTSNNQKLSSKTMNFTFSCHRKFPAIAAEGDEQRPLVSDRNTGSQLYGFVGFLIGWVLIFLSAQVLVDRKSDPE